MSKAIKAIFSPRTLVTAAVVAGVAFLTGGIGGAITGAGFVAGAAAASGAAIVAAASTVVLTGVSAQLAKKPKAPEQQTLAFSARDRIITIRQPAAPRRVVYGVIRAGGVLTFMHVTGASKEFLHMVITLAGHRVASIGNPYFNGVAVPLDAGGDATGTYAGHVHCEFKRGIAAEAAFPGLKLAATDKWTSNHRQEGCASVYVRLTWNADLFPNGIPAISFDITGHDQIYDPRTGLRDTYSNAALVLAEYLENATHGLGMALTGASAEVDATALTAAANVCDEDVTLSGGGTENRYEAHGTFDTSQKPADIIAGILSAMGASGARAIYVGGKWVIQPAAWRAPTITLTESDLRAGYEVQSRLSRRELCNAVKGLYVSAANDWQISDFPPVTNATYLTEDQGERIWKDIELPWTKSAAAAQRIAKIELERTRQQITVVLPCKISAWRLQAGDTVQLTIADMGWTAKAFEVQEARFAAYEEAGAPALGVDLLLRETASANYDWNSGEETAVDPAPDTSLPDPFTVAAPGAPEVAEALYETTGGAGVKARAALSWAASADAFAARYEVQHKLSSASAWTPSGETSGLNLNVDDIAPGVWDFRVRAISGLGVRSGWSTASNRVIAGLSTPPAAVTGLGLNAVNGQAHLRWDAHPALDVKIGGFIRFRYSRAESGASWANAVEIGPAVPGSATQAVLPLLRGTYLAKAFDSSGNASASASFVVSTRSGLVVTEGYLPMNVVQTIAESAGGFTGVKTNTAVNESSLRLDGVSDIDDWGSLASPAGSPFRRNLSTAAPPADPTDFSFDMGAARLINSLEIADHTIPSGATVKLQGGPVANQAGVTTDGTGWIGVPIAGFGTLVGAGNDWAMGFTVKTPSDLTGTQRVCTDHSAGGASQAIEVNMGPSLGVVVNNEISHSFAVSASTVYRVLISFLAGDRKFRLYKDGVLQATSGAMAATIGAGSDFTFMRAGGFDGQYLKSGAILGNVIIYGEYLDATEALAEFNGTFTASAALKGKWLMDEGAGTAVDDSSPENNNGTLTAGASWSNALPMLDETVTWLAGTITHTVASASRTWRYWRLRLEGGTVQAGIGRVDLFPRYLDDVEDFDSEGGVEASGNCLFASTLDLGAVYTSRVTGDIGVVSFSAKDKIDSRTGNIDDWEDFDGGDFSDAKAELLLRTTDDDPAGAPVWSAWRRFLQGDYTARAFQFKIELSRVDADHNVRVNFLEVRVDMPDRVEAAAAVAVGAGGTAITFANAFRVTPAIQVTVLNASEGDTPLVTAKSATGFTVQILNGGGVARDVDWTAKGYGKLAA